MRCHSRGRNRDAERRRWRPAVAFAMAWLSAIPIATPPALAAPPPCPPARPQALDLPATRAAVARGEPIVIVAFGSSSTEGSGASTPADTYPARLQALLRAAWPGHAVRVLNRGKGGQTTDEMLARLDADVTAASPTLVIWQHGANATLREMDPARFAALTRQGIERIVALGVDLVVMDNQLAPRILRKPRHALYGAILANAATGPRVSLFSRSALMRDWAAADRAGPAMIGEDGLHHTDRGYACLAAALGQAIAAAAAGAARPTTPEARAASGSAPPALGPRADRLWSHGNRGPE